MRSARFELTVGAPGVAVTVLHVRGEEAVSRPFWFEIEVASQHGRPLDLGSLLRARATLALGGAVACARGIHGVLSRVELSGVDAGRPRYQLRLVPALGLLDHVRRSRAFQHASAADVAAKVLAEAGVRSRSALTKSYPERELLVQYRESDLAFAHRLLASEGISYRFDHGSGGEEVVLCDAPSSWGRTGHGSLPYLAGGGDEEHVFRVERRRRLDGGSDLWEAHGTAHHLEAGCAFEVDGHPDVPPGPFVALRIRHDASQEGRGAPGVRSRYVNRTLAAEAAAQPRRQLPRARCPRALGLHTARVTGAPGEEIHADRRGRIEVRFPWDREAQREGRGSCWVPLGQAWSGAGYGAMYLPRVGQEVVLRFLEGDPDRPIAAGALYDGAHAPPVTLPAEKTRSTLRSGSSPGGGGHNELCFEDAAGAERVLLRAQRDERVEIGNDAREIVRRDLERQVGRDGSLRTGGERGLQVGRNASVAVAGSRSLEVGDHRATLVGAAHVEQVGLAQSILVGGARVEIVGAGAATQVAGAALVAVGGALAVETGRALEVAVGRDRRDAVGAAASSYVGGDHAEQVQGDASRAVAALEQVRVTGAMALSSGASASDEVGSLDLCVTGPARQRGHKVRISAASLSVVVGGQERIAIDGSGRVLISARDLTLTGCRGIQLKGGNVAKR